MEQFIAKTALKIIGGLCFLPFSLFSQDAVPAAQPALADKTLVVWVSPSNLSQRGGSALTLEDRRDHFDGIVFGELSSAKWMAGSDSFSRTQKDQSRFPLEDASPGTFVQVAIVYRGREVAVYRNGTLYSRHTIPSAPQQFPAHSMVIMGKRHQHQGDQAHFAGAIDDARIYDRALSAEELSALKPNAADGPKLWAWWSFDDGTANERTGRYAPAVLSVGAKIVDGRLILDGKTGTFLARSVYEPKFTPETPARPANPPANWLSYHLAHPGPGTAMPGDPNCAFYWKGKYHLHYIYTHNDGFSFAHISSEDLIHWKWHPTTLTPPKTNHGMFSGTGFFTREGRPAIIYHGQGSGRNQVAVSEDDDLEKWSAPIPVEPRIQPGQDASKIANWDPDAWLEGDRYYALSGGNPGSGKPPTLFRSADLKSWDYLGLFLSREMPDVQKDEDISCPNFFKIGAKYMLLCISHNKGCRYYLGDWKDEKFTPDFHARMNWRATDFFAPESLVTADGRRVMWAWCNLGTPQSGIQSLPRELSLPEDGVLRIKPLRELESLREEIPFRPGALEPLKGDTLEIAVTFPPNSGKQYGMQVYCDSEGKGGLPITVDPAAGVLSLGTVRAPFDLKPDEQLKLRIFLDKNVVEVFANDRQALVVSHAYDADHLHVHASGDAVASEILAWKMKSIYAAP
jgi:beta-fructofuranosidase